MLALCAVLIANPAPAQQPPNATSPTPATPAPLATNLQLTLEAWNAFRAGDNNGAIAKADQCIQQFRDVADQIEANLAAEKESLPKGKASPADKRQVDQYEVLHDVARCCLIKGLAEEKLGHQDAAREAYAAATKFKQARIHDPATDSFWSPAEKAAERLANLKDAPTK
jgi:hypothetical protein